MIVVSGGHGPSSAGPFKTGKSVQVLQSNGSYLCNLPDLPDNGKHRHSQKGLELCGSGPVYGDPMRCEKFEDGEWKVTHNVSVDLQRQGEIYWFSPQGKILIAGCCYKPEDNVCGTYYCSSDTLALKDDGSMEASFNLNHGRFISACSFEVDDQLVITGGWSDPYHRVRMYNQTGFVKDYPDMNYARGGHACGYYKNSDNKMV